MGGDNINDRENITIFKMLCIFCFQSGANHMTCKCLCISVYTPNNTEQLVQTVAEITVASEKATMIQGGSNMTGTDLYVNKPHSAAAVRP